MVETILSSIDTTVPITGLTFTGRMLMTLEIYKAIQPLPPLPSIDDEVYLSWYAPDGTIHFYTTILTGYPAYSGGMCFNGRNILLSYGLTDQVLYLYSVSGNLITNVSDRISNPPTVINSISFNGLNYYIVSDTSITILNGKLDTIIKTVDLSSVVDYIYASEFINNKLYIIYVFGVDTFFGMVDLKNNQVVNNVDIGGTVIMNTLGLDVNNAGDLAYNGRSIIYASHSDIVVLIP